MLYRRWALAMILQTTLQIGQVGDNFVDQRGVPLFLSETVDIMKYRAAQMAPSCWGVTQRTAGSEGGGGGGREERGARPR